MITIFTPTYNRKNELINLYNSLLNQHSKNFEWLIVDDGSTDDTKESILHLKKENKVDITYVYKKNGGKQSAYNKGLSVFKGDIFLCIDSDDILVDNIIEKIEKDFKKIKTDKTIAGIMYVQSYIHNKQKIIGTDFPTDGIIDTYYNIYNKHKISGDKLIVLKREIAKEFDFPLFKNEKFIPEALIFNRMSKKYKLLCSNKIAACKDYLNEGYSSNYFNLVKRNPKGNMLYYKEAYDFKKSLYNVYGYILFSIYAKYSFKRIIKDHPAKAKILLLYLPTLIISKIK